MENKKGQINLVALYISLAVLFLSIFNLYSDKIGDYLGFQKALIIIVNLGVVAICGALVAVLVKNVKEEK